MLNAILLALVLSAVTSATNESGRGNFLQCYANSALEANKGKTICHPDAKFCIQEITNATRRSDCGLGKHSTDVWDRKLGKCLYRKCSNKCPSYEDDRLRDFNVTDDAFGLSVRTFSRKTYCCNTNLCNTAGSNRPIIVFAITTMISLFVISM